MGTGILSAIKLCNVGVLELLRELDLGEQIQLSHVDAKSGGLPIVEDGLLKSVELSN